MEVKNKIAIVTGASSGIGLATAKLLSKLGTKVCLVARTERKLPGTFNIKCDMSNVEDIKKMVKKTLEHFGRIDILINNAGIGYDAKVEDIEIKKIKYIVDLDLIGPIVAIQEVIPIMRKQKQGTIINTSSGTSRMYLPTMAAYSGIKRALNAVSLTARLELAKDNISVSVVYPYITATDFEKNTLKSGKLPEWDPNSNPDLPPPDSAQKVAEMILEAIKTGKAEIFANKNIARGERFENNEI